MSNSLRTKYLLFASVLILFLVACFLFIIKEPNQRIPSDINESKEITFFALGDAGKGNFVQWRVAKAMEQVAEQNKKLDFVAILGDNFYTGRDLGLKSKVWNAYFENVYSGRFLDAVPFYAVLGNHDKLKKIKDELAYSEHNSGSNRWRMPARFYARDMGNIGGRPLLRVVFLDTQPNAESLKTQADFIQKSFAENTKQPVWRIVIGHHPVRNYGKHADETALMQQFLLPAFKVAKIDAYISGHDHNQQAIVNQNEPLYFISGGGGADLYPIKYRDSQLKYGESVHGFLSVRLNKSAMHLQQYDAHGLVLKSYHLQQGCLGQPAQCLSINQPKQITLANFAG
jgi:hypothetical protein